MCALLVDAPVPHYRVEPMALALSVGTQHLNTIKFPGPIGELNSMLRTLRGRTRQRCVVSDIGTMGGEKGLL